MRFGFGSFVSANVGFARDALLAARVDIRDWQSGRREDDGAFVATFSTSSPLEVVRAAVGAPLDIEMAASLKCWPQTDEERALYDAQAAAEKKKRSASVTGAKAAAQYSGTIETYSGMFEPPIAQPEIESRAFDFYEAHGGSEPPQPSADLVDLAAFAAAALKGR